MAMSEINNYIKNEQAQGLKTADSTKKAKEISYAGLRTELLGGKKIKDRPVGSAVKVKKKLPVAVDIIAGILMLVLVLAVIIGSYLLFRYYSNDYDGVDVEYQISVSVLDNPDTYRSLEGEELFMDVVDNSVYFGKISKVEVVKDPGDHEGNNGGKVILTVDASVKHRDGEGYSIGDSRLAVGSKYAALRCGATELYNVLVTALSVEGE